MATDIPEPDELARCRERIAALEWRVRLLTSELNASRSDVARLLD